MPKNRVLSFLTPAARLGAERVIAERKGQVLSEVRLRTGHVSSLTFFRGGESENAVWRYLPSNAEMRDIFAAVCGGSVYAFEESIREGYVTLDGGIRVGVGGRAVVRNGGIGTLSSVDSLVFRLPRAVPHAADGLAHCFREYGCGILLFAPPGGGKTTVLREFAREISRGERAYRVAVIDARGEFYGFEPECLVDVLSGYPKAKGAEIAVRTLSPQLLVMDEIGAAECEALLSLSSLGVPVVASVHGCGREEVLAHAAGRLIRLGVFSFLWDVRRARAIGAE